MSILDLSNANLSETFEPVVIEKGSEVKFRVLNVIEGKDKNGNAYIMPFFEIPEEPYCKEFGDYMPLPHPGMNAKQLNQAKLRIVSFFKSIDIDHQSQIDTDEVKGREGWAIVGVGKDKEELPVNTIAKYIAM